MEGEGFEAHVSEGQAVKAGDKLISFDLELIREKAKSTITQLLLQTQMQLSLLRQL